MKDLSVIETILRNRYHFFVEIREGIGLPEKEQLGRAMQKACGTGGTGASTAGPSPARPSCGATSSANA